MDIFTLRDLEWVFAALFAVLFAFLALKGLVIAVEAARLDLEIHLRYRQRADFVDNFYQIYNTQKLRIEEERRLEKEAREARYAAIIGA